MSKLSAAGRREVHASPDGSRTGDGTEGYPVRTIEQAMTILRAHRKPMEQAVVWLHPGTYALTHPLVLGPEDSDTVFAPTDGDGTVAISGGASIREWTADQFRGMPVWAATVPTTAGRSLFVNGERRSRPRYPAEDTLRMVNVPGLDRTADLASILFEGSRAFEYSDGEIPELTDPRGVEVVIPHFWIQERSPIESIDRARNLITLSYDSMLALKDGDSTDFSRYFLDGVVDSLGQIAGQWYFDAAGIVPTAEHPGGPGTPTLLYTPRDNEFIDEFEATVPIVGSLVEVRGEEHRPVVRVRFEGIRFEYAEPAHSPAAAAPFQMREDPVLDPATPYASDPQAASTVFGALTFEWVHSCALVACTVAHVGGYGVRLDQGSAYTLISGCEFWDLGAGAINCGGSDDPASPEFNIGNEVSDNVIHSGGRVYPHAVAVFFRHASDSIVAHNDIFDFFSTAISIGWRWDYEFSPSVNNIVIGNHLHTLGQGTLDWFGGIYTLGVSPGTVISDNLIHDVRAAGFGGWGILLDPASSHILVQRNIIHSVSHEAIHIKTGRENVIRDNLLAKAGTGLVSLAVPEDHVAASLTGNVFLTDGVPVFAGAPGSAAAQNITNLRSNVNLAWDETQHDAVIFAGDVVGPRTAGDPSQVVVDASTQWLGRGSDTRSTITDPGLVVAEDGTIELAGRAGLAGCGVTLPAFATQFGPRPISERTHPSAGRTCAYRVPTEG